LAQIAIFHREQIMHYKLLTLEVEREIAIVTLNRPAQRNAIDEDLLAEIDHVFGALPTASKAVVLTGAGPHFCAGLDLKEHHGKARSAIEFMRVCQGWHKAFDKIQYGGIPVVSALHGAVVGGGLELAAATHVRVADPSTYFALPEGQKGIFTGGGATVRVARIINQNRMVEMMLTGRVLDAQAGLALGLAHEVTGPGQHLEVAMTLAKRIAQNAEISNYAMVTAIGRIGDMSTTDGLFCESLMAAVVQTGPEVQSRLRGFVDKSIAKVQPVAG
jgi:enoyl-CoA hydratase/carnithine racemase